MTFVVETGAGLANAESYISTAAADDYHAARGNLAWIQTADANPEAALRRATSYIDARYRARWKGWRTHGRLQALEWPRTGVFTYGPGDVDRWSVYVGGYGTTGIENDEIPTELKQATAEAALREMVSPGSLSPDIDMTSRIKSETVGPISTTYADAYGVSASRPVVTMIDDLLAFLLCSSGSTATLVRA